MVQYVSLGMLMLLFILAPLPAESASSTMNTSNIFRDIDSDVTGNEKKAHRLRLKKQPGLKLGRLAGVWGSIGDNDKADVFFLGKTPEPSRMQFTLTASSNQPLVNLQVTAKDGKKTTRHEMSVQAGKTAKQWFTLKGKVSVKITSTATEKSIYAAYFWYPGDRIDGLDVGSFEQLKAGTAAKMTSFARRVKGANKDD